jgi:hypothetical protein
VATIDLALVEDGIEFGKRMMAEMIASYSPPAGAAGAATNGAASSNGSKPSNGSESSHGGGGGYLNEVDSRTPTRT